MPNTDLDFTRLAARVGRHLLDSERIVATAESCTGGWIAKALTDIAVSSQWFIEGFVTYSNESKIRQAGRVAFRAAGSRRGERSHGTCDGGGRDQTHGSGSGGGG